MSAFPAGDERFEQVGQNFLRRRFALVGDDHPELFGGLTGGHADAPFLRRRRDGIQQQVDEHLPDEARRQG